MTTTTGRQADRALQAKHRAMWALGDDPAIAADVTPELGPELVAASGVRAGDRVLDVGEEKAGPSSHSPAPSWRSCRRSGGARLETSRGIVVVVANRARAF